jgi:hypothetical protein
MNPMDSSAYLRFGSQRAWNRVIHHPDWIPAVTDAGDMKRRIRQALGKNMS